VSWLDGFFTGYRQIVSKGLSFFARPKIDFEGNVTVSDDPTNNQTVVTFGNSSSSSITCSTLTCTGTSSFGGAITATGGASITGGPGLSCDALEVQSSALFDGDVEMDGNVVLTAGAQVSSLTWLVDVTETRVVSATPSADPANWKWASGNIWTNLTTGTELDLPIDPPQGCVISTVVVRYQGASLHGGLPGTMPAVALKYYDTSSNLNITVSSGSDTSANTTAFQTEHSITLSSVNHTVDKTTRRYFVSVTAESGANALTGASWFWVSLAFKRPAGSNIGQD